MMIKQVLLTIIFLISFSIAQQKTIYSVEKEHYFSSKEAKDNFKIILTGKSITEGIIKIIISTKSNDILFTESYPSKYLIGYGLIGKEDTIENEEKYILKRMNEFFSEDNFINNPIGINDSCESDYSDCETWEILKKERELIGFYFLIGEESGCWMAYSRKLKKVLKYYCCC